LFPDWLARIFTGTPKTLSSTKRNSYLSKANVILYSRPGCHLCEEAKEAMLSAGSDELFTLEEINIETDRDKLKKYQYEIPVIVINGVEAFRHRVDPAEFRKKIATD
jgi:glutaredoxin